MHFHTGNSCLPRAVMFALEVLRNETSMVTIQSPYKTIVRGASVGVLGGDGPSPDECRRVAEPTPGSPGAVRSAGQLGVDRAQQRRHRRGEPRRRQRASRPRSASGPATRSCCSVPGSTRRSGRSRPSRSSTASPGSSHRRCWSLWAKAANGKLWSRGRQARHQGARPPCRLSDRRPNWLAAATVWLLPTEPRELQPGRAGRTGRRLPRALHILPRQRRGARRSTERPDLPGRRCRRRDGDAGELLRDQELGHAEPERQIDCGSILSVEHGRRLPAHLRPDRSGASRLPGVVIGSPRSPCAAAGHR